MFAQHNIKLYHILLLNYMQIKSLLHITWQFDAFLLGNLVHYNSYSASHRSSSTPVNIPILSWKFLIVLSSFLFIDFFAIIRIILLPQRLINRFPNAPKTQPNSFDNILCFQAFLLCPCYALVMPQLVTSGQYDQFHNFLVLPPKNLRTNSCFHDKGNQIALRLFDTQCRQLTAHTVNSLSELFYIVVCFEIFRNF